MNVGAVGIEPKNDLGDICHGGFEKFCARENFTGTWILKPDLRQVL